MRGGLGAHHAFDQAGAEFFRMFGDFLLRRIGDEGSDGRAGSWNERTKATDQGASAFAVMSIRSILVGSQGTGKLSPSRIMASTYLRVRFDKSMADLYLAFG